MKNIFRTALQRLFGSRAQPPAPPSTAAAPPVQAVAPPELAIQLDIWVIERDRFGVRQRALSTSAEVYESEAISLCQDVSGYVLSAPDGEQAVIEASSGALIGYSLESVLDDIRDMPSQALLEQIRSNRREFERMHINQLALADFWAALRQPPQT